MRKVLHLEQGCDAWKAHRATPGMINGSEIAAIMGIDPKTSRSEMLRMKALGGEKEFSDYVQKNVIDKGHRNEALARPMAEEIIGDDLSPLVMTDEIGGLLFSVSLDGITQCKSTTHEHKSLNKDYVEDIDAGRVPAHHQPQCEAGLMVSGATRCLFMASTWDDDGNLIEEKHCWYESNPELRPRIIAACKQFEEDRKNYVHVEQTVAAVAAPIESLPALAVTVTGSISLAHNLDRFGKRLTEFVGGLNAKPETDQDFADLDAAVKVLKEAEAQLDAAESNALAQTTTIADMQNLVAMYRKVARDNRLMFEKIVKAEKENRRAEIIRGAQDAYMAHVDKLNQRVGGDFMPRIVPAFAESIKGLKSLDSMRDKVSTALANAKIEANDCADRIEINKRTLDAQDDIYMALFPDLRTIITKPNGDFMDTVNARISAHKEAEARRLETERERIRQEEADRITREAARADLQAKAQAAQDARDNDQRGKADAGSNASGEAADVGSIPQPVAASTPPIQDHFAGAGNMIDEAIIDDFIRLLSIGLVEKKALRPHLLAWERYRISVQMKDAA